jgi:PQQ-dependent catabolism-associated beta-propeller protein
MHCTRRSLLVLLALFPAWALLGCKKKAAPELVYVSAEASGEVVVIDPKNGSIVTRIPVGKRPRGLKLSPDGKTLYVALSGSPRSGPNVDESTLPPADRAADGVGVIDLAQHKLLHTLPSGQDPESFDLSLDGKTLYISNEETSELSVLDIAGKKVTHRVPVGGEPEGVSVRPDGKVVYVTSEADSAVFVVDTHSLSVVGRIATGLRPRSIAFSRDSKLALVTNEMGSSVTLVDAEKHAVLGTIAMEGSPPARPMGTVLSADGDRLFVSTGRGGAVAVIDLTKRMLSQTWAGVGTRPWGIALSRDGKRLFTANGPSDDVSMIDVSSGKVSQRVKVGGSPWGVVVSGG